MPRNPCNQIQIVRGGKKGFSNIVSEAGVKVSEAGGDNFKTRKGKKLKVPEARGDKLETINGNDKNRHKPEEKPL